MLITLTGCSINEDSDNQEELQEILRSEQFEVFDVKMFTLMENILGINFKNYRLITTAQEKLKDDTSANKGQESQQTENKSTGEGSSDEKSIEITQLVDDNTIFADRNEPDWEKAKQYVRQISDVFIDIQIELQRLNVPQEDIIRYGEYISNLVYDVSSEDREKSIDDIHLLYSNAYDMLRKSINNQQVLTIKKLYYDSIQLILYLEEADEENFNKYLEMVKVDVQEISQFIQRDNEKYIEQRINMIVDNIVYDKKNDARLKIVMLVNCIPILEFYEFE